MKITEISKKDYILVTPKELKRMACWFNMASNRGDNDITKADRSLNNKLWDIIKYIQKRKEDREDESVDFHFDYIPHSDFGLC